MNALMRSCEDAVTDALNQSVNGEKNHDVFEYEEQNLVSQIYYKIACKNPSLLNVFSPCGDTSPRLYTNFPTKLLKGWEGPSGFLDLAIVRESSTLHNGKKKEFHQHMFKLVGVIEAKMAITGSDIAKDLYRIQKLLETFKGTFGILVIAYSWNATKSRRKTKENLKAIRKVEDQNLLIFTEYSSKKKPWSGKVLDRKDLLSAMSRK